MRYCIDPGGTTVNWQSDAQFTLVGDDVYERVVGPLDQPDPNFPDAIEGEQIYLIGTVNELVEPTLIAERGYVHFGWYGSAAGKLMCIDTTEAWVVDVAGIAPDAVIAFDNSPGQPFHDPGISLDAQGMSEFRATYPGDASETVRPPGIKAPLTWPENLIDEPHTGDTGWARWSVWHGYGVYENEPTTEGSPIITVRSVGDGALQSLVGAGPMAGRIGITASNTDPPPTPDNSFWEPGDDGYTGPSLALSDDGLPPGVESVEVWAQTFGGAVQLSNGVGDPFIDYGATFYRDIYNASLITDIPGEYFYLQLFDGDGNPAGEVDWTDNAWFIVGRDSVRPTIYPTGPTQFHSVANETIEDSTTVADCLCAPFEVGTYTQHSGASHALLPGVGLWSAYSSVRENYPDVTYSVWAHFESLIVVPLEASMGTPRRTFQRGR